MQPIHELLNRIHWDAEFGKGDFELWFHNHVGQPTLAGWKAEK
jgi:hypothetical protein